MFTGLIQGLGSIEYLEQDRFAILVASNDSDVILSDLAIGDSVAVDGVCLTVEEILPDGFVATASPETLQRTNLGPGHQVSNYVNLETSLRVGSKIGGHFVTGHIDGVGCLVASVATEKAWEMTFGPPPPLKESWQTQIAPYLVAKGSIAVNGISLTVAERHPQGNWFKAAVIPHTYAQTNLSVLKIGTWVNVESDILGKYVARFLGHPLEIEGSKQAIDDSFLAEHGYI